MGQAEVLKPLSAALVPPESQVTPQFSSPKPAPGVAAEVSPAPAMPSSAPVREISGDTTAAPGVQATPEQSAPVSAPPVSASTSATTHSVAPLGESGANLTLPPSPSPASVTPAAAGVNIPELNPTGETEATSPVEPSLEHHLAALVERDKPLREAALRQNLHRSALHYAAQGQLAQARQTAQNVALSAEDQAALLAQINATVSALPHPAEREPATLQGRIALEPSRTDGSPFLSGFSESSTAWGRDRLTVLSRAIVDPPMLPLASMGTLCQPEVPTLAPLHLSIGRQPTSMLPNLIETYLEQRSTFNTPTLATPQAICNTASLTNLLPAWGNFGSTNPLAMAFPLTIAASLTSGFGWRIHPITGDRRFHTGIDLGAPIGTPVVAALSGQVAIADEMNGYGLAVVMEHQQPALRTLYAHLSAIAVLPGAWVQKGTVIGWVGSTGNSTGPHLHFEVQIPSLEGWVAVNPIAPETPSAPLLYSADLSR